MHKVGIVLATESQLFSGHSMKLLVASSLMISPLGKDGKVTTGVSGNPEPSFDGHRDTGSILTRGSKALT